MLRKKYADAVEKKKELDDKLTKLENEADSKKTALNKKERKNDNKSESDSLSGVTSDTSSDSADSSSNDNASVPVVVAAVVNATANNADEAEVLGAKRETPAKQSVSTTEKTATEDAEEAVNEEKADSTETISNEETSEVVEEAKTEVTEAEVETIADEEVALAQSPAKESHMYRLWSLVVLVAGAVGAFFFRKKKETK